MTTHYICRECNGTGWIPYHSETLDGQIEEAYHLCPSCDASQYHIGSNIDRPCPQPSSACYGLGYSGEEHPEFIHSGERLGGAREAIYYLRRLLWIVRGRANRFLEMNLSEALNEAETLLSRIERELDQN